MTSTPEDPTSVLDALEAAREPARKRELAGYLADLIAREAVELVPYVARLRRLRGAETDSEVRRQLRQMVNQLEERRAGIGHDEGLSPLAEDVRARIRRSLAELDTLYVSLESDGRGLDEVYERIETTANQTGGFGDIFKMRRREDGLLVAVKYVQDQWAGHSEVASRFRREAETLREIHRRGGHAHLLPWVEDGTDGKRAFVVTHWAQGGSLAGRLAASPAGLPLDTALPWLVQSLLALQTLHSWSLLHRDLKPANLFLAQDGGPLWLGDFGIVLKRDAEHLTAVQAPSPGTPAYAPPEQRMGLDQDERTDLFGWAATAYELLAGRRAASGDFGASPRAHRPEIPVAWDQVIRACRAERRADRPKDVGAVLGKLGETASS